jgi:glycosyltransferase involved in cell wall biosynthesis
VTAPRRVVMLLENNPYPHDVRVRNEAETLAAAGRHVTVIAPRDPGQPFRERVGAVDVRRFRLPRDSHSVASFVGEYAIAHAQLFARAAAELRGEPGVLHLHNPPDTLFPVGSLGRRLGWRLVYDHHDLFAELFEDKFGPSPVVRLLRRAQRASARAADLVVTTNESQREALLEASGKPADRVVVVRNGPRAASLAPAAPRRGGELSDPRLLFLGSLASQDGVDDLPVVMAALREGGLDPRLTIVGDGASRGGLERAFAEAGLAGDVEFTGWVAHDRVPGLLAGADICVDPAGCSDLNHRSTMIKIAEYLAAGRPAVAYELRETRRTAGDAVVYAPCGDSAAFAAQVVRLAREPELREQLAHRAAERVGELVWERAGERLVAAYEALG